MRLRNKKTGEIGKLSVCTDDHVSVDDATRPWADNTIGQYHSLAELNEEWEDHEEPKELWSIDQFGEPINVTGLSSLQLKKLGRIGNLFESEEKTERAAKKLKAWRRLEDKGFRFVEWQQHGVTEDGVMDGAVYFEDVKNVDREDLDLLFSPEEN